LLENTPKLRKTHNFLISTPLSAMECSGIHLGLGNVSPASNPNPAPPGLRSEHQGSSLSPFLNLGAQPRAGSREESKAIVRHLSFEE
jgi:hypothetical protein